MEFALISILTTVGGIILYLIMGAAVKAPGKVLASKFASLGNMSGKIAVIQDRRKAEE